MTTNRPPLSPFVNTVDEYICAGYQSLAINTTEIRRVEEELFTLPHVCQYEAVLTWDCVEGLKVRAVSDECSPKQKSLLGQTLDVPNKQPAAPGAAAPSRIPTTNAAVALKFSLTANEFPFQNCVIIFRNLHVPLRADFETAQLWQTAVSERQFNTELQDTTSRQDPPAIIVRRRLPIIIGTATEFSAAIRPHITNVEFELPDLNFMRNMFMEMDESVREQAASAGAVIPATDNPDVVTIVESATRLLLGLSSVEASDALALCAVRHGNLWQPEILDTIEHQKVEILQASTSLQYIQRRKIGTEDDIGGFSEYSAWIKKRRHCYTEQGMRAGLDAPRGVVLIGVPGTAKSLCGKISSRILNLPMVKMDVGAIFGSLVGQSEQRMADTIKTIEAMCGCVVLIDEADKLWGGADQASGDSGVTRRVFGKFLTWMAEKTDGSFVIMTVNRTNGLPPEFLRRGRFDEIWYTDIPEITEREQILRIHLRLRGLDLASVLPNQKDLNDVLESMQGFVGAEIEHVVKEARLEAYAVGKTVPSAAEFIKCAGEVIPLTKLDGDNIKAIQDFCQERARPVQSRLQDQAAKPIVGKRSVQSRKAQNPA